MIKISLLVRSLDRGGSERQLLALANSLDKNLFDVTVFTFYSGGLLEKELEDCRVRVVSLRKRGRWDLIGFFRCFAYHLRRFKPDVIHGYLDISNLLALSARLLLPRAVIIWGARSSACDLRRYDWLRRASFRLECKLSSLADCIIVNSYAGRSHLVKHGYAAEKLVLIQNGIDTDYFRLDSEARRRVRGEWRVPQDALLVGLVARLDPVKDHSTFLRAAALLYEKRRDVRFVCVGSVVEESYRREMEGLARELSLTEKLFWAGERSDMRAVYNALDVNVSSSESEGFSNVIGEAMACAVPCVVTDTGDSALIVGDTGFVSATCDAEALAANLALCLESDRNELGARARLRIEQNWNVRRLAERTERAIIALMEVESRQKAVAGMEEA